MPHLQTMVPEEDRREWYEMFEDIYDTENCIFEKKLFADHRNHIKLNGADMMLNDLNLPDLNDPEILWLDRNIIGPLEDELQEPMSKQIQCDRLER